MEIWSPIMWIGICLNCFCCSYKVSALVDVNGPIACYVYLWALEVILLSEWKFGRIKLSVLSWSTYSETPQWWDYAVWVQRQRRAGRVESLFTSQHGTCFLVLRFQASKGYLIQSQSIGGQLRNKVWRLKTVSNSSRRCSVAHETWTRR